MKAIDQLEALIGDMKSVFAPVLQTQLGTLIAQAKAEKPTVVIFVEGGLIAQINSTHELTVVQVDFDIEGVEPEQIKETPYGEEAMIEFGTADTSDETPEAIAKWVTLANQE